MPLAQIAGTGNYMYGVQNPVNTSEHVMTELMA